ncbi:putative transport protein [Succinivibrio dextrinosolvens]|uniref:putative transporter n=1 Tax=Succinivibrio dextrinosolvens TaxID=83771 RepID=UPI0008F1904D|nr:putative transporter [Succinivibrio dextrinosolvens]SFS33944.1 putative transport protein [Succinivibrio dextrinosolvens]
MSSLALLIIYVSVGAVLGIGLGQLKYKGVGVGIGGVLFSGIFVGHMAHAYFGFDLISATGAATSEETILHFLQEFGLMLFVYAIGIQVGPSFFAALRGNGLKLITLAVSIIVLGCIISLTMFYCGIVTPDAMVGMYSGGITNTPALSAAIAMVSDLSAQIQASGRDAIALGFDTKTVPQAYAVAYPFGVCSILITMILLRAVFHISIEGEGSAYAESKGRGVDTPIVSNVEIENSDYFGKTINDIPCVADGTVICSRIKRDGELSVPTKDLILKKGDIVHLVGGAKYVQKASQAIGTETKDVLTTHGSTISVRHLIITNNHVMGRTLAELDLENQFGLVISRVFRSGIQFMPTPDLRLALGDEINVVGTMENIRKAGKVVGNSSTTMNHVPMMPIFIGLFLGMLLGSVPIPIPGVPAPMKLGVIGGTLVCAIMLARFGDMWTKNVMHWRLPVSALSAFKEIGITLFLTIVGIRAGANGFWETLTNGLGLHWMAWATLISIIPLLIVGFIGAKVFKINYLVLCGVLAGSYTDPPALAYANGMYKDAEASSIGYATVYPFVMFLRILSPQVMLIIISSAFI